MIPRSELYYFVPGQVILHIDHDEMDIGDLKKAVDNFLNPTDSDPERPWAQLTPRWDQTITLPLIKLGYKTNTSLILTEFTIPPLEEYRRHVYENQDKLIDLLVQLYNALGEGFVIPYDKYYIFLHYVSPNWLTSGTPHQPASGGPGSWPVPAAQPHSDQWKFNFPGLLNFNKQINRFAGDGVEVAILDTAHSQEVLDYACSNMLSQPLVNGLLGEQGMLRTTNGALNIVPYIFSDVEMQDLNFWPHFSLVEHRYKMPDHGLFVAGIIHAIAPKARLKLYEVLNQFGTGNYQSIYTGLYNVLADYSPEQKLVINMSLVFNMPFADKGGFKHCDPGLTDRYLLQKDFIIKMTESIQEIIKTLVSLENVHIVAAAGNDAQCNIDRPPARYPAAFPGVIGIGALPRISYGGMFSPHRAASYSNLCDQPPYTSMPPYSGYMTLGGEPGEGNGVLGVYISPEFPDYESRPINNGTRWAWWAGTSFATPIISGLLAFGWSNNWDNTGSVYKFLNQVSGFNRTNFNERVIVVTQT